MSMYRSYAQEAEAAAAAAAAAASEKPSPSPSPLYEETLQVPRSCLRSVPHRLSFDNGATLCKLLVVADSPADAEQLQLRLLTVRKEEFADTVRRIKEDGCCQMKGDGSDVVKMTGVNFAVQDLLKEQFNASCEHVNELLTQVRGCHWVLTNLPPDQILLPPEQPDPIFHIGNTDNELVEKMRQGFAVQEQASMFPAVLAHLGSGTMISVLSETGRMERFHFSMFGGKALQGLSLFATGTNSYDELFALAERGDRSRVDTVVSEVMAEDPSSPYGRYDGDLPMMHFGKAAEGRISAAEAKKEDIARSLVSLCCWNLFGQLLSICTSAGISRVYFGGNFFRHRVARVEFENVKSLLSGGSFQHFFLKGGGHMGAIGALIATNADAPDYLHFG